MHEVIYESGKLSCSILFPSNFFKYLCFSSRTLLFLKNLFPYFLFQGFFSVALCGICNNLYCVLVYIHHFCNVIETSRHLLFLLAILIP